jgi:hypothetical protein
MRENYEPEWLRKMAGCKMYKRGSVLVSIRVASVCYHGKNGSVEHMSSCVRGRILLLHGGMITLMVSFTSLDNQFM